MPAIVLDIDGTVLDGTKVIGNAAKTIPKILGEKKLPFLVLTNDGGMAEASKAKSINAKFGMENGGFEAKNIHLSSSFFANPEYVEKYKDKWVLANGANLPSEIIKILYGYGYKKVVSVYEL